jgi:hypothetical protein
MRRTQLHLERAELRAQYGYLFERGSAAARELAKMREGSSTLEVKELEAIVNSVRIDKSHLDAKIAAIDARLGELSPRAKP